MTVKYHNGTKKNVSLPFCDEKKKMVINYGIYYEDFLFFDREDIESGEKFLQVLHLPAPFNTVTNNMCIPIAVFYYMNSYAIAIHKIDGSNALKRWVANIDNKQVYPVAVGETKHVCFIFNYSNHCDI